MQFKTLIFLAIISIYLTPFAGKTQAADVNDSLALVDLYNSTTPSAWSNKDGWLAGPLNTWYGVAVNNAGKVTRLNLAGNGLLGSLPQSIGNLTALDTLNLSFNNCAGKLPPSLGNLTDLTLLDISYNNFYDTIPAELGNLTGLTALYAHFNQFTGIIPGSFGNLVNLKKLNLTNNKLTGHIPQSFGNLTNLTDLRLALNGLTGAIPSSLGNLQFTVLLLNDNQLSSDTPDFVANNNNAEIDIRNNRFNFTVLEAATANTKASYAPQLPGMLHINHNSSNLLSVSAGGTLSKNTYSWYALSKPGATQPTVITGDSTFSFPFLGQYRVEVKNSLAVKATLLSDTITLAVPANTQDSLALIDLFNNANGTAWTRKQGWKTNTPLYSWDGVGVDINGRVASLNLYSNNMTGPVPASFANLTGLTYLQLSDNKLSGNLLSFISNFTMLTTVDVSSNQFTGSMPSAFGNLTSLTKLTLSLNQFTGNLPASLGNLSSLTSLSLSNNKFSGNLLSLFDNLKQLTVLDLGSNQFTGSIPAALHNLDSLSYLALNDNLLSGTIPDSLLTMACAFTKTLSILVDRNQLTGGIPNIPPLAQGTTYRLFLSATYNQLSGSIGSWDFHKKDYPADFRVNLALEKNNFNFGDFAPILYTDTYPFFTYTCSPQNNFNLSYANGMLYAKVGGAANTYNYEWRKNGQVVAKTHDSTFVPTGNGLYYVTVTTITPTYINLSLLSNSYRIGNELPIVPAKPAEVSASYEITDTAGWTHYYYNNNTSGDLTDDILLLSLKKNGQDIGVIGDDVFAVKLVATAGAGSNTGIKLTSPLITNPTGFYVMNRYWQVTATQQPKASVGVRFYYNNQDLADVNGSYPTHNLTNDKLIFYKAVGGNPDPTSNLAGATKLISIMPGTQPTDTSWVYHQLSDTTQYGEYSVASFSGGGGGGTGNNKALPVTLLNFTGNRSKTDVQLSWQTAQEINAGTYFIERSLNGTNFTGIGNVQATGNSTVKQSYNYIDVNVSALNTQRLYYRLKIVDKDGGFSYSKIISLQNDGITAAYLLYPNPTHTAATIQFTAGVAAKYTIAVIAADGKIIKQVNVTGTAGINRAVINVSSLPQGAYKVTITSDKDKQSLTLVKE